MADGRKGLALGLGLGTGGGGGGAGGGLGLASGSSAQRGPGGAGLSARLGGVMGGLMSWGHPTTPADTIRALEAEVKSLESLHRWVRK